VAETGAPAKRWVIVRQLHGAVERAEHEIAELKAHGLFVRDATGSGDNHDAPAAAGASAAQTTPPAGTPPAGGKPEDKKET